MQESDLKYQIDMLINNQWKTLGQYKTIQEVCLNAKLIRTKSNYELRVLENDILLEFINDDNFSLFYFIQKYEHYDSIREMLQDQKVLGRYYKFVGDVKE